MLLPRSHIWPKSHLRPAEKFLGLAEEFFGRFWYWPRFFSAGRNVLYENISSGSTSGRIIFGGKVSAEDFQLPAENFSLVLAYI